MVMNGFYMPIFLNCTSVLSNSRNIALDLLTHDEQLLSFRRRSLNK